MKIIELLIQRISTRSKTRNKFSNSFIALSCTWDKLVLFASARAINHFIDSDIHVRLMQKEKEGQDNDRTNVEEGRGRTSRASFFRVAEARVRATRGRGKWSTVVFIPIEASLCQGCFSTVPSRVRICGITRCSARFNFVKHNYSVSREILKRIAF